jgi:site-specific recombinase XerD
MLYNRKCYKATLPSKTMAFERIEIHKIKIEDYLKSFRENPNINEEEKKDVEEFIRLGKLGAINKRKKLSDSRCAKFLYILRISLEHFGKNTKDLTLKDVEKFDTELSNDVIKNRTTNQNLAQNTKIEIRKILKIYLRWKLKDNLQKFNELTDWWDTTYKHRTPEFLSEQEVIQLFDSCKNINEKFIVGVLFDAGCRIGEFINLRFEDITEPTENFPYFIFDFKEEYSKTKGRKIGLFWERSEKTIKDYLSSIGPRKREEVIFKSSYDNIRKFLNRLGKRVLNRDVFPHLMRHSSATYYAPKINRQQLCIRYGWSFTSEMPDVYIARAGIDEKQIMESFKSKGMEKFRDENETLKKQITNINLKVLSINKENDEQNKKIKFIIDELKNIQSLQDEAKEYVKVLRKVKN